MKVKLYQLKIISGGQTGADRAGLRAARHCGIETGGYIPKGFLTEEGPKPGLVKYGLKETASSDYKQRTLLNIKWSDLTLIVHDGPFGPGGTQLTIDLCKKDDRPYFVCDLSQTEKRNEAIKVIPTLILSLARENEKISSLFLKSDHVSVTINVAGPRESRQPGLQKKATRFLERLFTNLERVGRTS